MAGLEALTQRRFCPAPPSPGHLNETKKSRQAVKIRQGIARPISEQIPGFTGSAEPRNPQLLGLFCGLSDFQHFLSQAF